MNLQSILRTGRWGSIYFVILFGIGFILGMIRVPYLEPRLGVRAAELTEAPCMFLAILFVGRWIGRKLRQGSGAVTLLATGLLAAGLILGADIFVGIALRHMALREVFTTRDPVSGSVYYTLLAVTALTPWFYSRAWARAI